jgi:beta-lactam-binding protein with PASTA domain
MQIFSSYSWLIPFLFFIAGYACTRLWLEPAAKPMPNLVGKSTHEALGILSTYTLNPRVLAYKNEPDIEQGTILSQTPTAGKIVKSHQSVFLILAQEPEKVRMIPVVQQRASDAVALCSSLGLTPQIYYVPNPWPAELCFAQYPSAGSILSKTTKPILYISSGEHKMVIWPSFIGNKKEQAIELLKKKNIVPDILYTDSSTNTKPPLEQHVVDQRPLAGSLVDLTYPEKLMVQLRIA